MEQKPCLLLLAVVSVMCTFNVYSVTASDASLRYALYKTALTTCGQSLYPDSIYPFVFPITERTKDLVDESTNITMAKAAVQQQMDLFCSRVSVYTTCVKERLTSGNAVYDDRLLSLFVDGDSIPAALDKFCDNKDLVLSQFECTYQSLQSTTCNGGIVDILEAIITEMNSRSGVLGYSCKNIKERFDCRIQKQLTPCNATYANVMSDVIKGMLRENCEKGDYIEPMPKVAEMTQCFFDYSTVIEKRLYTSSFNTSEKMGDFIVDMMESFCGIYTEMIECAVGRADTSQYHLDIMFRKITNEKNLKEIMKYGCSNVPLFDKYSTCVMEGLQTKMSIKGSCFEVNINKYSDILSALFNPATSYNDTMKASVCTLMDDFGRCMAPVFSDCNAELGGVFSRFVTYNFRTCQDTTYVIPSGASRALPILSLLLSIILIAFVL